MESVKKPGKHGESTGKPEARPEPAEPEKEHGLVDPFKAHKALEAAGWNAVHKGISTNSYEHPDHPGHVIGLSDEGAWAHNRFNVKLPKGIPGNPAYPPKDKGGRGKPKVALKHPETGEPVKTGDEATGPVSARQSSGKRDVSEREARPEAARGHSIIALPDLQPGQRAPAGIG